MSGHDWAEAVGAVGIFAFITTVITVIIVQVGATSRAKAALAREDEFPQARRAGAPAPGGHRETAAPPSTIRPAGRSPGSPRSSRILKQVE